MDPERQVEPDGGEHPVEAGQFEAIEPVVGRVVHVKDDPTLPQFTLTGWPGTYFRIKEVDGDRVSMVSIRHGQEETRVTIPASELTQEHFFDLGVGKAT